MHLGQGFLTLLNFSNPPSVSLIVFIHDWAFAYLDRSESLKGSSHGSRVTTPEVIVSNCWAVFQQQLIFHSLPVPSFGMLLCPSPTVPDVEAIATCMVADSNVCMRLHGWAA